jgi:flagellar biosynthetic protein FliQ
MTPDAVATVARETIMTLLMVSAPAMAVALGVGLLISLVQALTSIQEVTLTFVPKIILVFAVLILTMPFMASHMQQFTEDLFTRMAIPEEPENTGAAVSR